MGKRCGYGMGSIVGWVVMCALMRSRSNLKRAHTLRELTCKHGAIEAGPASCMPPQNSACGGGGGVGVVVVVAVEYTEVIGR